MSHELLAGQLVVECSAEVISAQPTTPPADTTGDPTPEKE